MREGGGRTPSPALTLPSLPPHLTLCAADSAALGAVARRWQALGATRVQVFKERVAVEVCEGCVGGGGTVRGSATRAL